MRPDLTLTEIAAELTAHPGLDAFADGEDPAADVRAAFSWSYRQLAPGPARVFRLVGLHPGPGLERYAVASLTGLPVAEAVRFLDALTRSGMIQPTEPGRYGMHDLLRGYARELAASQEGSAQQHAARTGLFDYYLHTATIAAQTAFPADRRPALPALPGQASGRPVAGRGSPPRRTRWPGWPPSAATWPRSRRMRPGTGGLVMPSGCPPRCSATWKPASIHPRRSPSTAAPCARPARPVTGPPRRPR